MDVAYYDYIISTQLTGQGKGNCPTVYGLVQKIIIVMIKNKGHKVEFWSSLSLVPISIIFSAFVDNADLVVNAAYWYSTEEYLQETFQQALYRWAGALGITGREIDP